MYNKEYYEKAYDGDYEGSFAETNLDILFNHILRYKRGGELLDLGCAYGYFLKKAEKQFNTYGIDVSEYALEKAKRTSAKSELRKGNAEEKIDFFNKKFDVIVAHDLLEHLKNPEKTLRMIRPILKDDGLLFIRVPNTSCLMLRLLKFMHKEQKWVGFHETHISVLTIHEWKNMLKRLNFRFKIIANPPTLFLKKALIKHKRIIIPSFFYLFNHFVTLMIWKDDERHRNENKHCNTNI